MLKLTKELRARKQPGDPYIDISLPRDIFIYPQDIILMESISYPFGHATHIMICAGGQPISFAVVETPEEILEKIKIDNFT